MSQIQPIDSEMWVVVNPDGHPLKHTLSYDKLASECYYTMDDLQWEIAVSDGYTCVPVRVRIEPIDNNSSKS